MRIRLSPIHRLLALFLLGGGLSVGVFAGSLDVGALAKEVLIVGGGPDLKHNQVAIESNVRYAYRLLPKGASARILFTNGDPSSSNVLYEDSKQAAQYRKPNLPRLDGPSSPDRLRSELADLGSRLQADPTHPALLYFTGHGSGSPETRYANNHYDLWNDKAYYVSDLAASLQSFPKATPIVLVMVQCFSGAFGNVLFEMGNPNGALVDRRICGFFAASPDRMAAGCTPEVNEANYRDFTGYFFGALTGTDRVGKPVTGADYNHDGKVGMNEAFAFALIHDESIDTPVCTSDVFLRHFTKTPDAEIMKTPFSDVRTWARPEQLAALDGLSDSLGLSGEDRIGQAFEAFKRIEQDSENVKDARTIRFVRLCKTVVLDHQLRATWDAETDRRYRELLDEESKNPMK